MPILAIDEFGNFYQTGRDRADGRGYSNHATPVTTGDVTLGSAHLKAMQSHTKNVLREHAGRQQSDREDAYRKAALQQKLGIQRAKAMSEDALMQNELYRQNLVRKAVQMGYQHGCKTVMSGDPMSANGQSGAAGYSRDQQAIRHLVTGFGAEVSYKISKSEAMQRQAQANMNAQLTQAAAQQDRAQRQARLQMQQMRAIRRAQSAGDPNASRVIQPARRTR